MALQSTGSHNRELLVASTTYTRSITIGAGTNRRLLVAHAGQRFYIDSQTAITFNGVAGTPVNSTSSSPAARVHMWSWNDPAVGAGTLEITNNTNRNDGAWFWAVFDEVTGAITSAIDESASDNNANPPATVTGANIAFLVAIGLTASNGGTTPFASINSADGVTATGVAPNRTYASATQLAAVTAVVPQGAAADTTAPTVTGPGGSANGPFSISTAENTTTVGTFTADEAVTWSKSGTDQALYTLTPGAGNTVAVAWAAAPNFDSGLGTNPKTFTLTATDGASPPNVRNVTITNTVTDVNEAPVFAGTISVPTLTQGSAMTPISLSGRWTDPENNSLTYALVGSWPAGLSISGGNIQGTPSVSGTFAGLSVTANDGTNAAVPSNTFSITINASGGGSTPVSFTGTVAAQSGTVGTTFSWSGSALSSFFSGSLTPFTFSVFSGSLPPGLTLNASTGVVSGTPTTAGTYNVVFRAADTGSNNANTGTVTFTIAAAPGGTATGTCGPFALSTGSGARLPGVAYTAWIFSADVGAATAGVTWAQRSGTLVAGGPNGTGLAQISYPSAGTWYTIIKFEDGRRTFATVVAA